jgi:pimeloyl-ACP methyl ester carboxylesterase
LRDTSSSANIAREMKTLLRVVGIGAFVVLALYVALLAAIYFGSDKLVFPGAGAPVQHVNPGVEFPGAEDVNIPVDGATFAHAWWIPSASGSQQTLLCFHGNGYALEDELTREAPALYETGANLLLVDYRGYGTSSKLATSAESTTDDARAAFHYLTDQHHVAPSDIWIFGRSIGASIAVRLATETPNAGGLILLTPITNTADVEPYRKLVKPLGWLGLTKVWNSLARMPQIHVPVTIIAGSLDTLAPPWMAQAPYDAANNPKTLKIVDGADHNDILAIAGRAVVDEIKHALAAPVSPNTSSVII